MKKTLIFTCLSLVLMLLCSCSTTPAEEIKTANVLDTMKSFVAEDSTVYNNDAKVLKTNFLTEADEDFSAMISDFSFVTTNEEGKLAEIGLFKVEGEGEVLTENLLKAENICRRRLDVLKTQENFYFAAEFEKVEDALVAHTEDGYVYYIISDKNEIAAEKLLEHLQTTDLQLTFNGNGFVSALPTFLFGMVGVFFVLSCIMVSIYLLKAFAGKKK